MPINQESSIVFNELGMNAKEHPVKADYSVIPFRGNLLCQELGQANGNLYFIDKHLVKAELRLPDDLGKLFSLAETDFGNAVRYVSKENNRITEKNHSNIWEHKDVWVTYNVHTTATFSNESLVISSKTTDLNNKLSQYLRNKEQETRENAIK